MNDNKGYRIIAIVALLLGVVGVTLGYAAFSNTLTISSSAEVRPDPSAFNVDFSTSSSSVVADPIVPTLNPATDGPTATNGVINNANAPTATNLKATFTEPGQEVTYSFYAYNAGEYIAYLNSIVFSGTKTCTGKSGTTQALVDTACNGINLSVKVGSEAVTSTSIASIASHSLGINGAEEIEVTISYDAGSGRADGDFDVTLPDIVLTYDSVD